jgi:hypothetical protein
MMMMMMMLMMSVMIALAEIIIQRCVHLIKINNIEYDERNIEEEDLQCTDW